jgi:hypothetical protein
MNLSAIERPKRNAMKGHIEPIAALNGIPVAVSTSGTDQLVCWRLSDEEMAERIARGEALRAGRQQIKEEGEAANRRRTERDRAASAAPVQRMNLWNAGLQFLPKLLIFCL